MRDIKFRAWSKKYQKMFFPSSLEFYFNRINIWRKPFEDETVCWLATCKDTKGSVLMQYTGLKDKNRKEIYEGDIVKYKTGLAKDEKNIYGIGYIGFEYALFCIIFKDKTYKSLSEMGDLNATLEIIGNIYENPELLNNTNS